MKKLNTMFLIISILSLGLTACGSGTSSSNTTSNSVKAIVAEQKIDISQTPTQTAQTFLEAVRQRNYTIVRETLSQRSLDNLQQTIARSDINLDQTLKRIVDQDAQGMVANNVTAFEFRNEQINNDHASLEVKATNAPQYARISLTKESSKWKINIDETTPIQ